MGFRERCRFATSFCDSGTMTGLGQIGRRLTSEDCASFVLTTTMLLRARLMAIGAALSGAMNYADPGSSCPVFVTVDTTNPAFQFIELSHQCRDGSGRWETYRVPLEATLQPFGGVRWWFRCSRTGRRCMKLYLPSGGHRFLSRAAWGLAYACEREDEQARAQRQAIKAYRALRGEGNWRNGAPSKPKWMRWRTYERIAGRLDQYNDAFDEAWAASFVRLALRA